MKKTKLIKQVAAEGYMWNIKSKKDTPEKKNSNN